MKFNFKPLLSSFVIGTIVMVSSVAVSAGGTAQLNNYTGKVDGGTVKINIMGGVVIDDTDKPSEGICGYDGNPVNLKIQKEIELEPVNPSSIYNYEKKTYYPDILAGAFKDCDSLKTIELTANDINTDAFVDCDNLECVTLKSVENHEWNTGCDVEEGAFKNCKSLKKIIIISSAVIRENSFINCPIETVVLPEKYDEYIKPELRKDKSGNEYLGGGETYSMPRLAGLSELKNVNIPYGTFRLFGTFKNCTSLESIELPETVCLLNEDAFQNCTSLTEVKILNNEVTFYADTFSNCPNLTIVCNPESKAVELCKKYNINCVDFNGNAIYCPTDVTKSATSTETKANNSEIKVILNDKALEFSQPPVIENGTTLVPMRAIFEAMGATVEWNNDTKTVTSVKEGTTISLTLNSSIALVNNNETPLSVPAKLVNESTMVPLRFVSESLGAEVNWDSNSRTITINS